MCQDPGVGKIVWDLWGRRPKRLEHEGKRQSRLIQDWSDRQGSARLSYLFFFFLSKKQLQ